MPTARAILTDVQNAIDYLVMAELAFPNAHAIREAKNFITEVSWTPHAAEPFLRKASEGKVDQYRKWVLEGHYSAILFDGALLQMTYACEGNTVVGHRLAYVPCPVRLDPSQVQSEALIDCLDLELCDGHGAVVLASVLRFDYDPRNAKPGHPSAHLTINAPSCRIAACEPMHLGRFLDLIFRQFYPTYWEAHRIFFEEACSRRLGSRVLSEADEAGLHIAWRSGAAVA